MAVQTVLQSSQDQAALLVSGQDYEQWIRHGSMADHPMDSASNMEEPAQGQSCHIALHFTFHPWCCHLVKLGCFAICMQPCRTCLAVSFPRVFFPRHPLTGWPGSGTAFHCGIVSGSMKQVQSSSHNSLTFISFTIGPMSFVGGTDGTHF